MTFEVDVHGQTVSVSVEEDGPFGVGGGRLRIAAGGDAQLIDVTLTDLGLCALFPDGRVVDAAVTERSAGEWLVQVPRVALTAVVDGRRHQRGASGDVAVVGEQHVTAPMPGRVVRVLVTPGDHVAARQGLVVVEAMKMENELTSPKDGRVKKVAVAEGQPIESGRLLVVIE